MYRELHGTAVHLQTSAILPVSPIPEHYILKHPTT